MESYSKIQQSLSYTSCCAYKIEVYTFQRDQLKVAKHVRFIVLKYVTQKTHKAQNYCLQSLKIQIYIYAICYTSTDQ